MMTNDFQIQLLRFINNLKLPMTARIDFLTHDEDLVIFTLPGGKVDKTFMDGTQEVRLPYQFAIKTRDNEKGNKVLWMINEALSQFNLDIPSSNGSYQFLSMTLSKPFLEGVDEQGFYVYLLQIEAHLEIGGNI